MKGKCVMCSEGGGEEEVGVDFSDIDVTLPITCPHTHVCSVWC